MEHGYLFLNELFKMFHIHIPMHVAHSYLAMLILILASLIFVRTSLIPKGGQNFFEVVISGIEDFVVANMGEHGRFTLPFLATIFIYIFVQNLMGLFPGFTSATANVNTNLAMAICVFLYTHIIGFRAHGVKYLKHFIGPIPWLAPVIFPIELIGHFARMLSLTIRLFGNIMSKEVLLGILFMLAGYYLAPLPVMILGIFVCFVQALIFFMLSMMYFTLALEEAH